VRLDGGEIKCPKAKLNILAWVYPYIIVAADALGDFKTAPGETPASLADRLAEFLKKKFEEGK
jgi:hypothetical protein